MTKILLKSILELSIDFLVLKKGVQLIIEDMQFKTYIKLSWVGIHNHQVKESMRRRKVAC